jgi:hypothetical protein
MLDGLVVVVVDTTVETPGMPVGGHFCEFPAADDDATVLGGRNKDDDEDDAPAVRSALISTPL